MFSVGPSTLAVSWPGRDADGMDLGLLADAMTLEAALQRIEALCGGFSLVDHFQQGEFHHDVVVRARSAGPFPSDVLVVATNCNGGVKEILVVDRVPTVDALWHRRCPENGEFRPDPVEVRAEVRTPLWFEPCMLLADDARSELRPEHRERQRGGGWCLRASAGGSAGGGSGQPLRGAGSGVGRARPSSPFASRTSLRMSGEAGNGRGRGFVAPGNRCGVRDRAWVALVLRVRSLRELPSG